MSRLDGRPLPIAAALLPWRVDLAAADWDERLDQVLSQVSAAGFRGVDLTDTCLPFGDIEGPTDVGRLAACLDRQRLTPVAVSVVRRSVIHPDEQVAAANLMYSLRAVDLAAALGIGIVSVGLHVELSAEQQTAEWFWTMPGHVDPDSPVQWRRAVDRLGQLADHAALLGVEISLEMYEDTYLGTAASATRLLDDIARPNVGLNPDTGNLLRAHRPVESWQAVLEATLPRANYWHMKNYLRSHDPRTGAYFTAPTSLELGVINYRRALEIADEVGYAGPYCLEQYGGDALGVCITNHGYLTSLLDALPTDRVSVVADRPGGGSLRRI